MTRRIFIGRCGGAIVAAATPRVFTSYASSLAEKEVTKPIRVISFSILAKETGIFDVRYQGQQFLGHIGLAKHEEFLWSEISGGLRFCDREPALSIEGPPCSCDVTWIDAQGRLRRDSVTLT